MMKISKNTLPIVLIIIAIYAVLLYVVLNLNLDDVSPVLSTSNLNCLIPTVFFRVVALLLHSFSWYFLIKVLHSDVSVVRVLGITLAAILTEVILPIGGVTEVAKVLLASQLLNIAPDAVISALLLHRLLLSVITAAVTIIAINIIEVPLSISLTILSSIVGLLVLNAVMLLLPSSQMFKRVVGKFIARFNISIQDPSAKYRESMRKVLSSGKIALILTSLTILAEKFSNGVYGIYLCRLMSTDVNIFTSLIVFDSIYVIIWLLPVVTPGNVGVFETVQIMIFKLLGTSLKSATLIALLNRAITLITELPLMLLSTTYLGIRARQLIKTLSSPHSKG